MVPVLLPFKNQENGRLLPRSKKQTGLPTSF
jgi:hypothetical protein